MGDLQERFWEKVDVAGADDCWEWTASKAKGYGKIYRDGKLTAAHRLSWEFRHGEIPAGLHILHKCDNPACVNPEHLFTGTQLDNLADMREKGRQVLGVTHGNAKLTKAQVIEIRLRYAAGGVTQAQLGANYGVTKSLISVIVLFKGWRHI